MFEVGDCPIEVNLKKHDLLLGVVLLIRLFLVRILDTLLSRNGDLGIHIVLDLFLMNNDGVGVILDGLIIPSQHEFGVGFAEVVLYHVVVTVLEGLADVFERGLVLIQLVVDD